MGHSCSTGGTGVGKLNMWRFEYFNYGQWQISDSDSPNGRLIPLFDTDTAATGMRWDVTLTAANTYQLNVYSNPLSQTPALIYSSPPGTMLNPGTPLDWFSITFFNSTTDAGTPPTTATDFYIRSMEITGSAAPGVPGDYNNNGLVDAADYVLWRKGGPLANEVDTPGTVNAADYTAWRARFGNPSGSGAGLSGGAVPESCTFALLISAIGILTAVPNRNKGP
jgi:hypothetical protein